MFMMAFLGIGLILLAAWAAKVLFDNKSLSASSEDALSAREILARRYARGEISKGEYERMLGDLG